MGLIKRSIGVMQDNKLPLDVKGVPVHDILPKLANDAAADILHDLHHLFHIAHSIFADLLNQTGGTAQRINNLNLRIENCQQYLPQAEAYILSLPSSSFTTNPRTTWSSDALQTAQLLTRNSRDESMNELYEKSAPPPNFTSLDPFSEDRIPCLKRYTNPDFFIDEWLEQQKRERDKLMERREKRHNARKPKPEQHRRKSMREVEVGKLKKTTYDEFGNKIEVDSAAPVVPGTVLTRAAQPASNLVAISTMDATDKALQAAPRRGPAPINISNLAVGGYAGGPLTPSTQSVRPVIPPSPLSAPGVSTLRGLPPGFSPRVGPLPPMMPTAMAPPSGFAGMGTMRPAGPVLTGAPPPPPPPGPPAPPAPSVSAAPPASGITDARSSLLGQITAGLQLKKVEEREVTAKPLDHLAGGAAIDVSAILQRRVALEYSDDESDEEEEWDDDGDFDD